MGAGHGVDVAARHGGVVVQAQQARQAANRYLLDLAEAGITSIIWGIGYRPDYRWVKVGVFDGAAAPTQRRGITSVPGLYFLGLPWMHTWGSGRFAGIGAATADRKGSNTVTAQYPAIRITPPH